MEKGLRSTAQRLVNAETNFVDNVQNIAQCSREQAEHVFRVYKQEHIMKCDAVDAVCRVKHGAFLDRDVLWRAIAMPEKRKSRKP